MAKGELEKSPFQERRDLIIRSLNDIIILQAFTRRGLKQVYDLVNSRSRKNVHFSVITASGKTAQLTRTKQVAKELISKAKSQDIFAQSLIVTVALTEDYIQSVLREILLRHPQKLAINSAGKPFERNVSMEDVLEASSKREILSRIIDRVLIGLSYKSPADQFTYMEKVLSVRFDAETKEDYAEVKATRDIIVHNAGVVNDLYLEKAGTRARAASGDLIPLDGAYFSKAIQCMKKLINSLHRQVIKKYNRDAPRPHGKLESHCVGQR